MKKIKFLGFALVALLIGALVFNACEKPLDNNPVVANQQKEQVVLKNVNLTNVQTLEAANVEINKKSANAEWTLIGSVGNTNVASKALIGYEVPLENTSFKVSLATVSGDADVLIYYNNGSWVYVKSSELGGTATDEVVFSKSDFPASVTKFWIIVHGYVASTFNLKVYKQSASTPTYALPSGWTSVATGKGVIVASKSNKRTAKDRTSLVNVTKTVTDYVQVVDLKSGATVKSVYGSSLTATASAFSPKFKVQSFSTYATSTYFSVVNGQFFGWTETINKVAYAQYAFPIKSAGSLLSAGYGFSGSDGIQPKRKLVIYSDKATISESYDYTTNNKTTVENSLSESDNVLVGLHPLDGNPSSAKYYGVERTFIGVKDNYLFILSTPFATQEQAWAILNGEFKTERVVMFDGGGSGALYYKGVTKYSGRAIPHTIAVVEGK